MSRLDLVIFGATGFTGKKTVEEAVRLARKFPGLTWAVGGRSRSKLESVLVEASKNTGEDLKSVRIFVADVSDDNGLKEMCRQVKVVVNCCGPYRLYGEPVVRAAIDSGAHYVDVSGEPQFMERMQLQYNERAREAGVYVIGACGFDSIPNDMGVVFLQQNFNGTLNSVESYITGSIPEEYQAEAARSGTVHFGTWESLVLGLSHASELGPLRRKLFPERLPTFRPRLQPRSSIHKRDDNYCLPFPGADDAIVYRTQRYFYEQEKQRPVQFKAYIGFGSLKTVLTVIFGVLVLYVMSLANFTRKLLLRYPSLFTSGMVTCEGPKEEVMNNTHFQMKLFGEGWDNGQDVDATPPNKKLVAKVTGVNPGYGATVTALMWSALTVLKESHKMPSTGGVMTTGAAFSRTDLIKNLHENNLTFEILEPGN